MENKKRKIAALVAMFFGFCAAVAFASEVFFLGCLLILLAAIVGLFAIPTSEKKNNAVEEVILETVQEQEKELEEKDKKAIVERASEKDFGPIIISKEQSEGISVGGVKIKGFVTREDFEKKKKESLNRPLP